MLKGYYLKKAGIVNFGTSLDLSQFDLTIKKLISYVQLAAILKEFNLSGLSEVKEVLNYVATPLDTTTYSLDCLMIHYSLNEKIQMPFVRLLWRLTNTVIYVALAMLFTALYVLFDERNSTAHARYYSLKRYKQILHLLFELYKNM